MVTTVYIIYDQNQHILQCVKSIKLIMNIKNLSALNIWMMSFPDISGGT